MTATIRYYYSHTDFDTSGDDAGKDPITVQLAHRATAPLSLYAGYARGYESFETVTAGRLQQRGADTVSAGFSWRSPRCRRAEARSSIDGATHPTSRSQ
jgi:hypothetical protein